MFHKTKVSLLCHIRFAVANFRSTFAVHRWIFGLVVYLKVIMATRPLIPMRSNLQFNRVGKLEDAIDARVFQKVFLVVMGCYRDDDRRIPHIDLIYMLSRFIELAVQLMLPTSQ